MKKTVKIIMIHYLKMTNIREQLSQDSLDILKSFEKEFVESELNLLTAHHQKLRERSILANEIGFRISRQFGADNPEKVINNAMGSIIKNSLIDIFLINDIFSHVYNYGISAFRIIKEQGELVDESESVNKFQKLCQATARACMTKKILDVVDGEDLVSALVYTTKLRQEVYDIGQNASETHSTILYLLDDLEEGWQAQLLNYTNERFSVKTLKI